MATGIVLVLVGQLLLAPHVMGENLLAGARHLLMGLLSTALSIFWRGSRFAANELFILTAIGLLFLVLMATALGILILIYGIDDLLAAYPQRFLGAGLTLWIFISMGVFWFFVYKVVELEPGSVRSILEGFSRYRILGLISLPTLIPFAAATIAVCLAGVLVMLPLLCLWIILLVAIEFWLYVVRHQFKRGLGVIGLVMVGVGAWSLARG